MRKTKYEQIYNNLETQLGRLEDMKDKLSLDELVPNLQAINSAVEELEQQLDEAESEIENLDEAGPDDDELEDDEEDEDDDDYEIQAQYAEWKSLNHL